MKNENGVIAIYSRKSKYTGKGEIKALVVYRLDRVSRNVSDFSGMIENLSDNMGNAECQDIFDAWPCRM